MCLAHWFFDLVSFSNGNSAPQVWEQKPGGKKASNIGDIQASKFCVGFLYTSSRDFTHLTIFSVISHTEKSKANSLTEF